MGISHKIRHLGLLAASLPATICFNLKYFPFRQAIKLPVFLYSARFSGKGKYLIEGQVKPGMIRLGYPYVSIYKSKGVILENKGLVVFKGRCHAGAETGISVGEKGILTIGDRVGNTYKLKIVCYHKVTLGNKARIGWDTLICDTDFHSMKSIEGKPPTKGFGEIIIGNDVWTGSFCKFYKNTVVPDQCTVASNTFINKKIECEPYSLIYPDISLKVRHTGYYRDLEDDRIQY